MIDADLKQDLLCKISGAWQIYIISAKYRRTVRLLDTDLRSKGCGLAWQMSR